MSMTWRCGIILILSVVGVCASDIEYPVRVLTPTDNGTVPTWWRIDPPLQDVRRTDARLVSTMVDTVRWHFLVDSANANEGPVEAVIYMGAFSHLPASAGTLGEFLIPLPLEIAGPSWQALASGNGIYKGTEADPYLFTLRLGLRARGSTVAVNLSRLPIDDVASPGSANETSNGPLTEVQIRGTQIDVKWRQSLVMDDQDLIVEVNEIHREVAPGVPLRQVWQSAIVEWVRLPVQDGEPTVWWSPVRAGMVVPLQAGTEHEEALVADNLHPRSLSVSEHLADPRTGVAEPGIYIIRLTVAWLDVEHDRYTVARSRPHRVEVRASND